MTRARLNAIGYCARMTGVGDWAFQFAFNLARHHDTQLDIFFFPTSPCEEHESRGRRGERFDSSNLDAIEIERRVRLYYDELLGDYLKVGFRLCLGDEAPELRRCLLDREYDVLVLAYEKRLCPFGERPIEEFAERMQCPVVLIGPDRRDEIYLNSPARLWTKELGLDRKKWQPIGPIEKETSGGIHMHLADRAKASLRDMMSREEWFAFERQVNERTGLNVCTYNDEGAKVTAHRKWSNLLCRVIRADHQSALAICGIPQEVYAAQARQKGQTVIGECEAGLVKFCLPVFIGDEYRGLIGCCGVLMEDGEVEIDIIATATGLSHEAINNLSNDIPRITRDEAEDMAWELEKRAEEFIARIA